MAQPGADFSGAGFVGLCGCGQWGRNLARVLREKGRSGLRLPSLARKPIGFPNGVAVFDSLESLLERSEIRSIVIAASDVSHDALVERALEAGRSVFVEKPLAMDAGRGRALVELARVRGLTLMVGHLLCYHPAIVSVLRAIRAGAIGRVHSIYSVAQGSIFEAARFRFIIGLCSA